METKTCQNCSQPFRIESEDFAFYRKINVPPPTWCPECRLVRRMLFRQSRTFYYRNCDLCGRRTTSLFSRDKDFIVYCHKCWWSDAWGAERYAADYDFSQSFFDQLSTLHKVMPKSAINNERTVNSDYSNNAWLSKNCYLCMFVGESEDCMYGESVFRGKNIIDSIWVMRSENCYQCIDCTNSYNVFFSQNINYCLDSYFLYNCKNCSNCFGCVNLRNKQYYIFNQPYSKEEYFRKIEEFNLDDTQTLKELGQRFEAHKLKFIRPHAYSINCVNVTGNNVVNSKNCINCFDIEGGVENSKNIFVAGLGLKDSHDLYNAGSSAELCYESIDVGFGPRLIFSQELFYGVSNIFYSLHCYNSQHLFGCVGLRNKQYCILNKQYTKEEYEKLVPKIIAHMNEHPYTDQKGRVYTYGEFFPPELSPFAYNETIAQEYFPLTKEQAIEKGYAWKDPENRDIKTTISSDDLPDHIKDVPDTITKEIIGCAHKGECNEQCTTAFKIIPPELDFYRRMKLPLPRLCPNCRHYARLKQRNPLKLWHRQCQCAGEKSENGVYHNTVAHLHGKDHCKVEFETTYAPERQEIVYCEKCYQVEVV